MTIFSTIMIDRAKLFLTMKYSFQGKQVEWFSFWILEVVEKKENYYGPENKKMWKWCGKKLL